MSYAMRCAIPLAVVLRFVVVDAAQAAPPIDRELQRRFDDSVRPFLKTYCLDCHGQETQEAKLDLSGYLTAADVARGYRLWDHVLARLESGEMPPEDAARQPKAESRKAILDWIRELRSSEARRTAGDPGPVLARRLSNAEYDYTIRDLTGVDLRPTREFPVDPANAAGFDNSGESLSMSPALFKKYLAAARSVADHLVLKPDGFAFAPHPTVTDSDRDKYVVQRIMDFYGRQPLDLADYLVAAWKYRHREALDMTNAKLAEFAAESQLSAKYLATVWAALTDQDKSSGPLAELRTLWSELPAPSEQASDKAPASARRGCEAMRDMVQRERQKLRPKFENLAVPGVSSGSQPLVLWKNRQYASSRMLFAAESKSEQPAAELSRFCRVFPDAFVQSERDRPFLNSSEQNKGRLLNAGFHLMFGFFRDDQPLYELLLDGPEQRELDGLWRELNFVTFAPLRQYKDFIFFERAEPPRFMQEAKFDFARSEDKDSVSPEKIERLRELYLGKVRAKGGSEDAIKAIEDYFTSISAEIRWVEKTRLAAEPSHLTALLKFAERAYRRHLTSAERDDLLGFYKRLREKDGLAHEDAVRDSISGVLVSPHFFYRFESPPAGKEAAPLGDNALASRLSFFLWSSMPDQELLDLAQAGKLRQRDTLIAQTKRLMKDTRVRRLAVEFGGNWLDFRRFEEHNSVDRERFKSFTNELRAAMFEEPVRFFEDVVRQDRSVLDFLYAKHTFVNPVLAKHYGIDVSQGAVKGVAVIKSALHEWVRVEDAARVGRGGLLPMSVFLTANSPGLRTSPVKRGYWVVRRLLGESIPPPPPTVPELPKDESQTGDRSLRELLAAHREHKNCAACHQRFDSLGLVFEGYGPIGEWREKDLGGRAVDAGAEFPGGSKGAGLDGLLDYLRDHRQNDFLDNLCRKLLSYALGRSLVLSDELLIQDLHKQLVANDYRFGSLVETIVASPQFLNQRGRDFDASQ